MKNNAILFLAVFFLLAGISRGYDPENMFERLKKGTPCKGDCPSDERNKEERTKEDIMQVVDINTPALQKIYREHLKQKPGLNGKVVLKFTIAADGKIIDINIISSTTEYIKFDKAIKNKVATWKWKPIKGGNTTPTIPFKFSEEDLMDI